MREFNLDIFFTDIHKRISHVHRVTFVLQPEIKVKGIDLLDGNFKFQHRIKAGNYSNDKTFQPMVEGLRSWLFKKNMSPITVVYEDESQIIWRCSQEFNEEEKKFIKRLYLMEEL